jgi:hypothetical protein
MWEDYAGKTHCQEFDDPFDPGREDHRRIFSVSRIVASDVIVGRATSMSAESDVLI